MTAGADEAIDRTCRAYLQPGREILIPIPTFEMFYRFAAISGGEVKTVPWSGPFPTESVIEKIGPETALVVMVSPNNPTGYVATPDDLKRVAEAARSAYVLLDHAYVEYGDTDLTEIALELENVLVFRTFSKAWGLAGCRVGYLLASLEVATIIRNAGNPYPVSALSIAAVSNRLRNGEEELLSHVEQVRSERSRLTSRFEELGVSVPSSEGNFVFAELGNKAQFVYDGLASNDVLVRFFPNRPEISTGLRISMPGNEESFGKLKSALDLCLAPEALLFDLDGVLANVEESYRRCTLETVRSFGVSISRQELEAVVLAGDANNDWILSQRILAQNGIELSFDDVLTRYQEFYLGTESTLGLRENESLLVSGNLLRELANRLPLGLVTGRPRAEACWFLEREGILDLFSTKVCLEDGPNKPDPAPVNLALDKLGVSSAWMIGDTPDDVLAAAGAGVLPLAVFAPNADREKTKAALLEAGVVKILDNVAAIQELLP